MTPTPLSPAHISLSRRDALARFGAVGLAGAMGAEAFSQEQKPAPPPAGPSLDVRTFGSKGDGATDDTAAFQKALDAAATAKGGVVHVSRGAYVIRGTLTVPPWVTLMGVATAPAARRIEHGSTLLALGGRGTAEGPPLITLHMEATLKGLTIFYPEQSPAEPVPYPWTVRGHGDNCAILDVLMVNPWRAVDFATHPCGRHFISGLYGQPLHIGIDVDQCLDVGRIENVHFWPFWTEKLIPFMQKAAVAFRFYRTDWELLTGCFALGYHTGFLFSARRHDAGNALIVNSGADACVVGVRTEYSQVHAGLSFQNCQINAGIQTAATNPGPVKFTNCAIYSPAPEHAPLVSGEFKARHALLEGAGRHTFIGCHFYTPEGPWRPATYTDPDLPAVFSNAAGLTVMGCDFTGIKRRHLALGPLAKSTIITATRCPGGLTVENAGKGAVETSANVAE